MSAGRRDAGIAFLGLAGWLALTYGLAAMVGALVWVFSVGILLVGVVGLRTLAYLLWHGFSTFLPKGRP